MEVASELIVKQEVWQQCRVEHIHPVTVITVLRHRFRCFSLTISCCQHYLEKVGRIFKTSITTQQTFVGSQELTEDVCFDSNLAFSVTIRDIRRESEYNRSCIYDQCLRTGFSYFDIISYLLNECNRISICLNSGCSFFYIINSNGETLQRLNTRLCYQFKKLFVCRVFQYSLLYRVK